MIRTVMQISSAIFHIIRKPDPILVLSEFLRERYICKAVQLVKWLIISYVLRHIRLQLK